MENEGLVWLLVFTKKVDRKFVNFLKSKGFNRFNNGSWSKLTRTELCEGYQNSLKENLTSGMFDLLTITDEQYGKIFSCIK